MRREAPVQLTAGMIFVMTIPARSCQVTHARYRLRSRPTKTRGG